MNNIIDFFTKNRFWGNPADDAVFFSFNTISIIVFAVLVIASIYVAVKKKDKITNAILKEDKTEAE